MKWLLKLEERVLTNGSERARLSSVPKTYATILSTEATIRRLETPFVILESNYSESFLAIILRMTKLCSHSSHMKSVLQHYVNT